MVSSDTANLHHVIVDCAALEPDQLELVRLIGQLCSRLVLGDDPASEALARLDDLLHALLEALDVFRGERCLNVEVVVEAVLDRGPDAELGALEGVLHRLGKHVGTRVTQHIKPIRRVDGDWFDQVAVIEHLGEVAQLSVDASYDDGSIASEEVGGRGSRRHLLRIASDGDGEVGHGGSLEACDQWLLD